MAIIYPARWTRGRILTQALERAGNTKILALARDELNRLLEDLYAQWEWPFLYTITDVVIATNGLFDLPENFIKCEDEFSLQILPSSGLVDRYTPIREIDIQTMDRVYDGVTQSTYPNCWAVDASTRGGVAWPMPLEALPCRLIHKFLPADMPTTPTADYDADIPLFPYGNYLANAMYVWALEYDENPLATTMAAKLRLEFENLRNTAIPDKPVPRQILLDPDVFAERTFIPEDWWFAGRRWWWDR